MLSDIGMERAVLAGIAQFSGDGLAEIQDIVNVFTFTDPSNQMLFKCMGEATRQNAKLDIAALISAAKELNLYETVASSKKDIEYINSLFSFPINLENLRGFAKKLAKLEFARKAQLKHKEAYDALSKLKGSESIDEIIGISERPVFDILLNAEGKSNEPVLIADGMDEYVQYLLTTEIENVGIPTPWPIYNAAIGGGFRTGGVNMIGARPKVGKAQPLDSIVYTPNGPITMADVKVGMIVSTPDGTNAKITHIHDHKQKEIYTITFNDGVKVRCCKDHLWKVKKNRRDKKWLIVDTEHLLECGLYEADGRPKWHIPVTSEVQFNESKLDINPYLLGLLIGDGRLKHGISLSATEDEIINAYSRLISDINLNVRKIKDSYFARQNSKLKGSNNLINSFRKYNLYEKNSYTKFIPKDYIYSSIESRIALLCGLFDTDGSVSKTAIEYSTCSEQLALDVKTIVESLGGLCTIVSRYTTCQTGAKCKSYRVMVRFKNCKHFFNLSRKRESSKIRQKPLTRKIISIKYDGLEDCRCITIDSSEQLYLTNNFVVTHNSTISKELIMHVTTNLNIPILYLDTEMEQKDTFIRSLASSAKIPVNILERGKFNKSDLMRGMFISAYQELKKNKLFFYKNVPGYKFEDILSIIRRWIIKHVGFNDDGTTKRCLIVYDYFKLMDKSDLNSLKEYEALGYQISTFTDFAKQFNFATLAFVQLNRQEEISQSDRLRWLCHSFSSFIEKTSEMIGEDGGISSGNRRMYIHDARFGPKLNAGEHINFLLNGDMNQVYEIGLKETQNEGNEVV
jgi:replicative DNA helicase